jgi:hypothetical protein
MKRLLLAAALLLAACATPAFKPGVPSGPTPWTHTAFDDASNDFSFAIVSDLESGYRPGVFDVAVAELKLLHPAFILTVGDMIDGGTEDVAELQRQWTAFDKLLEGSPAPFFHIAGNHDMTNTTQRAVWEQRYGPRYSHFIYKDVLFLALDTEDYPEDRMKQIYRMRADFLAARKTDPAAAAKLPYASLPESRTGEISAAQTAYFKKVIAENKDKVRWVFVLMHKPAYNRTDDLGLGPIERALAGTPHTILNGHLHRYSYAEKDGRDVIMLGTTGGERDFNGAPGALDHVMMVHMGADGPSIANLRLDGVLDKTLAIPANGAALCLDHGGPTCPAPK